MNSTKAHDPVKKPSGMKQLMKQYGYSALGVYLALSCIDLPLCFIMVRSVGEEKIEEYKDKFWQLFGYESRLKNKKDEPATDEDKEDDSKFLGYFSSTVVAQFIVAYGIHKSLIFIRLPITAAITPGIVSKLNSWGFKIGAKPMATYAENAAKSYKQKANATIKKELGSTATKKQRWWSFFF